MCCLTRSIPSVFTRDNKSESQHEAHRSFGAIPLVEWSLDGTIERSRCRHRTLGRPGVDTGLNFLVEVICNDYLTPGMAFVALL